MRVDIEKRREYAREYYKKNAERLRKLERENKYRQRYGIEYADFVRLVERQGGLCLICQRRDKLQLDHCHSSGKIRGALCASCNRGLGSFADDAIILKRAVAYLEQEWFNE